MVMEIIPLLRSRIFAVTTLSALLFTAIYKIKRSLYQRSVMCVWIALSLVKNIERERWERWRLPSSTLRRTWILHINFSDFPRTTTNLVHPNTDSHSVFVLATTTRLYELKENLEQTKPNASAPSRISMILVVDTPRGVADETNHTNVQDDTRSQRRSSSK